MADYDTILLFISVICEGHGIMSQKAGNCYFNGKRKGTEKRKERGRHKGTGTNVQTKPRCLVGTIDWDRTNAGETAIISKDAGRCTEILQPAGLPWINSRR